MDPERRQHRRLDIRLPLECYPAAADRQLALRTVTTNISTGGLYFEVDLLEGIASPEPRSLLQVELTVPPGDGHFPYQGRLTSVAEVVRCDDLSDGQPPGPNVCPRIGIAAQFRDALKLAF